MLRKLRLVSRSARLYLWPAAAGNTVVMSIGSGAGIVDSLLLALSICCLAAFGFLINDLSDRVVDEYNAAGRLERADPGLLKGIWVAALVFLLSGLLFAVAIGSFPLMLSLSIAFGLVLYSTVVRRLLMAANLLSALLGTTPLWAPLILWRDYSMSTLPIVLLGIYLMFVAREIILDIKDEHGDRLTGRYTFATVYGIHIAGLLAAYATVAAGLVFIVAAILASWVASVLQAVVMWSLLGMFTYLAIIPALDATLFSPLGPGSIANYILRSRVAMVVLPILLAFTLLGG